MKNICFISGKVNGNKVQDYDPGLAVKEYDSYFITDSPELHDKLLDTDWIPKLVECPSKSPDELEKMDIIDRWSYYTYQSKWMKLFPEEFIDKQYDYIVWSDSSYSVNSIGSIKSIYDMKEATAVMLHQHPWVKNIHEEVKECLVQERYDKEKHQYKIYIDEEIAKGRSDNYDKHYQGGYIIYNMSHPRLAEFRTTWLEHIHRCGIEDQISLNFVVQKFKDIIETFPYDIESYCCQTTK